jgi:hypothetical protein
VLWLNTPEYLLVQGSHDGYMRMAAPALHRRTLLWRPNQYWLILDEVSGKGNMQAISYLHFHPKLGLDRIGESLWRTEGAGTELYVATFGEQDNALVRGEMDPQPQGWYSEFLGERIPNNVLSLRKNGELPFFFGYLIFRRSSGQVAFWTGPDFIRIKITQAGRDSFLSISRDGTPDCK